MASQTGIGPVKIKSKFLRLIIVLLGIGSIGLAIGSLYRENAPDITSTAFVLLGVIAIWVASIGFIPGISEVGGAKLSGLADASALVAAAREGDDEKVAEVLEKEGFSPAEIQEVQVRSQTAFARRALDQIEAATGVTIQRAAEITRDGARNVVISGTFSFNGKRVAVDADHTLSGAKAAYPITRLRVAITHSDRFDLGLLVVPDDRRIAADALLQQDIATNGPLPTITIVTESQIPQLRELLTSWLDQWDS